MAKRFLYVRTASDDAACINCDVITDLALDGSGSYTKSMENLIEYMELINSTKK